MTYFSTTSAYTNIMQYWYYKTYYKFAYGICILIGLYSIIMYVKIGVILAILITVCFILFLFGGYRVELFFMPMECAEELEEQEPLLT